MLNSVSLLVVVSVCRAAGVTEYFSWSHDSHTTSDMKHYIQENFHTDTSYAFGWKVNHDSVDLVSDPHGSGNVLRVFYKDGTRTNYDTNGHSCPSKCQRGAQFYTMPPTLYNHGKTFAALEYDVYFKKGFEFVKGGKLPGLFGGRRDSCKGCSGEAHGCFSTRLMWREGGHYEVYAYLPYSAQTDGWTGWCNKYSAHKRVICPDNNCGIQIGLTSSDDHKFETEQWYSIRQEVNLGSPNGHGRISLWVDGELKVMIKNVVIRTSSSVHVDGMFFSTFYGGKAAEYGHHGDTWAYFRNFRITDEKYSIPSGEVFIG